MRPTRGLRLSSPTCTTSTMMRKVVVSLGLVMIMILGGDSSTRRVLAAADYYQRDYGYYVVDERKEQQQQQGGPVASRFPNYYREASDLLYDLSRFEALYIQYHSCQWTNQLPDSSDNNNNGNGNKNNNNKNNYDQVDENDYWYQGVNPSPIAAASMSVYGVLPDTRTKQTQQSKRRTACQRETFLNSYYIDPIYLLPNSNVQYSSCSSSSSNNNNNNNNKNGQNGQSGPYGLGCTESGEFAYFEYALNWQNEAVCDGNHILHVVDAMDDWNDALSSADNDCLEVSSDTAKTLLTYAISCSYEDPDCPDPVGMLKEYRTAARNPNRKNVQWSNVLAWSMATVLGLYVTYVIVDECRQSVFNSSGKRKWWQHKGFWWRFYETSDDDKIARSIEQGDNDSVAASVKIHAPFCLPCVSAVSAIVVGVLGLFGRGQRDTKASTGNKTAASMASKAVNSKTKPVSADRSVASQGARRASPAKGRPASRAARNKAAESCMPSPFFGFFCLPSRDGTVKTAPTKSVSPPPSVLVQNRTMPKVLELPRINNTDVPIPTLSPTSTFSSESLLTQPSFVDDNRPRLVLANMPVHDLPVKREKRRRWSFFPRLSSRNKVEVLPEISPNVMPATTDHAGLTSSSPVHSAAMETTKTLAAAEKLSALRSTSSIRSSSEVARQLLPLSDDQNSLVEESAPIQKMNNEYVQPHPLTSTTTTTRPFDEAVPVTHIRSERPFDELSNTTNIDVSSIAAPSSLICFRDDFRPTCTEATTAFYRLPTGNMNHPQQQQVTPTRTRGATKSNVWLNNHTTTGWQDIAEKNETAVVDRHTAQNKDPNESSGVDNNKCTIARAELTGRSAAITTRIQEKATTVVAATANGTPTTVPITTSPMCQPLCNETERSMSEHNGDDNLPVMLASTAAESVSSTSIFIGPDTDNCLPAAVNESPSGQRPLRDPEGYKHPFHQPVPPPPSPAKNDFMELVASVVLADAERKKRAKTAATQIQHSSLVAVAAPAVVVKDNIGRRSRSKSTTPIHSTSRKVETNGRRSRSKSANKGEEMTNKVEKAETPPVAAVRGMGRMFRSISPTKRIGTGNRLDILLKASTSSVRTSKNDSALNVATDQRTAGREKSTHHSSEVITKEETKQSSNNKSRGRTNRPKSPVLVVAAREPNNSQRLLDGPSSNDNRSKPIGIKEYMSTREQISSDVRVEV